MATATTLQVGYWSTLTDTFVAYPFAPTGAVYDLNDNVAWTLVDDDQGFGVGLSIDPPTPEVLKTANSRSIGERVVRRNYSHNRTIRAKLLQIPQTTAAAWDANLRNLIQLCEAITATQPAALKIQLTSSSTPVYADVLEAHVSTRYKETLFAQLMNDEVVVEFECRPFLRGPRQTLSNLVWNPGFEAPSVGNYVFQDTFATLNAYTVQSGGAPTLAANVMTMPGGCIVTFGSTGWSAIRSWYIRFQMPTGGVVNPVFGLHWQDFQNYLGLSVTNTQIQLNHVIAGTQHALATVACTVTSGNFYWVLLTQYPNPPGLPAQVQATLYNDSAGSVGAQVATIAPVAAFDGTHTVTGHMGIWANNTNGMAVGGAFSGVQAITIFGPGAWNCVGLNAGATGLCAGAWEQNTANTYNGGAATSYGAARMDLPPVGTVDAYWETYSGGGGPSGTPAMPAATGQALAASAYVRSAGLSSSANVSLQLREWDSSGNLLRSTTVQSLSGNVATWTQLSGVLTLGASTAYVSLLLHSVDTTALSANGMVWWDNCQVYNQTTTGQSSMPYCELRFPQSPAQILLTGVQGDVAAPALVGVGAFFSSMGSGATQTLRLGRRAAPTRGWLAIYTNTDTYTTPALNSAVYGGYVGSQTAVNTSGGLSALCSEMDLAGIYHFLAAAYCSQTTANVVKNTVRVSGFTYQGISGIANALAGYNGPVVNAGFTAQNAMTIVDGGQYAVPFSGSDPFGNEANIYEGMSLQYGDPTGSSTTTTSWLAYLPIDGAYLAAQFLISSALSLTNQWLWVYANGLATQLAMPARWRWSIESSGIPNPSNGVGGTGSASSGYASLNQGADGFLTLDPAPVVSGVRGVNQLLAQWNDASCNPTAIALELQYVPLYLWPL